MLPLLSYNGLDKVTGAGSLVESLVDSIRAKSEETKKEDKRTTLQVTVDRLVASGADKVRPIWLEPLPETLTLDRVLTDLGEGDDLEGAGTEPEPSDMRAVTFPIVASIHSSRPTRCLTSSVATRCGP